MELDGVTVFRLAADTAALVLIWLVQLVIYPAFLYASTTDFQSWHPIYTSRVTLVVMPIMLSQLGLYGYLALINPSWDVWAGLVLVTLVWFITFWWAVPLHGQLDQSNDHLPLATQLIAVNWWRTALWSLVWGLTVVMVLMRLK
ncbi:MAG: hypothetical protein AAF597_00275 [Bacteroidota bacterium]